MAFARLRDGTVVHHGVSGDEGSPALVLANSLGTDFRVWDGLLPHLGGRFRSVRYDMRGHGLTDAVPGPCAVADLADDLARLLDHLGVRGAVVCGLSIGGMVAQALAVARPDLVRGLVLMCTAHKIGTAGIWRERMEAVSRGGGVAAVADGVLQRWFTPAFHARRADELAGYRNMLARTPVEGYLACCAAVRDADLTGTARRIAVPTLCVAGDADGSTPPDLVRELSRLVPGACFELIEGAGHLPCVERPEATARAALAFLEGNGLAGG